LTVAGVPGFAALRGRLLDVTAMPITPNCKIHAGAQSARANAILPRRQVALYTMKIDNHQLIR
jgi:hypothetical protein